MCMGVLPTHTSVHRLGGWYPWRPEESTEFSALEFQTIVNCYEDARSSGRVTSALNQWPISPTPHVSKKEKKN